MSSFAIRLLIGTEYQIFHQYSNLNISRLDNLNDNQMNQLIDYLETYDWKQLATENLIVCGICQVGSLVGFEVQLSANFERFIQTIWLNWGSSMEHKKHKLPPNMQIILGTEQERDYRLYIGQAIPLSGKTIQIKKSTDVFIEKNIPKIK